MLALASNLALGTGDFIFACVDGATGTPDAAYALGIRPTYGSSGATDYCVGAMPGWEYETPDHTENACCRLLSDGLTSLSVELYDMNIFTANDITGSATLTDLSEGTHVLIDPTNQGISMTITMTSAPYGRAVSISWDDDMQHLLGEQFPVEYTAPPKYTPPAPQAPTPAPPSPPPREAASDCAMYVGAAQFVRLLRGEPPPLHAGLGPAVELHRLRRPVVGGDV